MDRIVERIGEMKSIDAPAKRVRRATNVAFRNRTVIDVASGTPLGHPLHPALVLLPAGSFLSASIVDFSKRDKMNDASQRLLVAGMVTAIPTIFAGLSDWRYTSGPERRVGFVHALANTAALTLYATSLIERRRGNLRRGKLLAFAGGGFLGAGGYLGGHLAYALGVGVDTNAFGAEPAVWTSVADVNDVHGDEFFTVDVNGERVLLTQVDGSLAAIANRCSHRGAPLDEGKREGNCVTCPWHQSKFDLRTGEVMQGPAVRPQQEYEVRIRDGKIELRRAFNRSDLSSQADVVDITSVPMTRQP